MNNGAAPSVHVDSTVYNYGEFIREVAGASAGVLGALVFAGDAMGCWAAGRALNGRFLNIGRAPTTGTDPLVAGRGVRRTCS